MNCVGSAKESIQTVLSTHATTIDRHLRPFVRIQLGACMRESRTLAYTLSPNWGGEEIRLFVGPGELDYMLCLTILDDDSLHKGLHDTSSPNVTSS